METVRRAIVHACAFAAALALIVGVAACGSSNNPSGGSATVQRGGTLRIGMSTDPGLDVRNPNYMQQHHWAFLNRTLYTFTLTPPDQGGSTPVPDLAVGMPEISADGLTYTVHIKRGLHFAPPFQNEEITSQTLVNSLESLANPRNATVNAGSFLMIKGIDQNTGKLPRGATHISGVSTPDKYTIVFRLNQKRGDFLDTLTWPALTPSPAGVMDAHQKDYGRYLVATGPYMVAGSDREDPAHLTPLSGYVPSRSLTLVRNPSWQRSTDSVRQANPDRVAFTFGDTDTSIAEKVTNGELDLMFVTQAPPDVVRQYETDPSLRDRIHINPKVSIRVSTFNVAQAPFDDVHVRRAVNYIISREDIRRADGGDATSVLAYHNFPPSEMGGLLKDYTPYATSSDAEALQKALAEMKQSRYKTDASGKCTDPVCQNIRTIPGDMDKPDTNIIRQDVAKIGLNLRVENYSGDTAFGKCNDPTQHVALCTAWGFGAGAPDAWGEASNLTTAAAGPNGCCNIGNIGLSAAALKRLGYPNAPGTHNFDAEVDHCAAIAIGASRNDCFAAIDREATDLALRLPVLFPNQREIIGDRVTNYTYDFYGYASLDRIALKQSRTS
jgi:peptide/nickel transport system substrate-binding protein